jgi:hypothetical protein
VVSASYSVSGTTATLTPSSALAGSTTYTATLTTGIKDVNGNALATSFTWSFNTVATSEPNTIFTSQIPSQFDNDSAYELGTKFWSDVNGQITQVRSYTNPLEGGNHTVRIWQVNGAAIVAGPYTWNITAGTQGWKIFMLPASFSITANTDYIVAISNSSDQYYAEQIQGFASPIVNGHLHTYTGSGLYSTALGTMPALSWQNTNYFRDIVFTPQ